MNIRRNRRMRSSRKHLADLSMTPLIDVALTLLIMFMVATPIIHNAIKVTLPRGQAQETSDAKTNEIIVYVDKEGDFYIDNVKINRSDIIAHLKQLIGNDTEKIVY